MDRIATSNLKDLELNLCYNDLGKNGQNLMQFGDSMKLLPKKLQNLKIWLSVNNLGGNWGNLRWLSKGM